MDDRSIPERFFRMAKEHPDRVLFKVKQDGGWKDVPWKKVAEAAAEIANGLMSLGLMPGERVAILSENRLEWIYADLGVLAAGGVTVTIYPSNLSQEIEYIVNDSGSRLIVISDDAQYMKLKGRSRCAPGLERIVSMEAIERGDERLMSLKKLREAGRVYGSRHPDVLDKRIGAIESGDLATMVYTSGTTGPPKGAMISHGNILFVYHAIDQVLELDRESDSTLSILPYAHVYERIGGVFAGVFAGVTIWLCEGLDKIAANVQEARPSFILGAPRLYEKMYSAIMNNIEGSGAVKKGIAHWAMDVGKQAGPFKLEGKPVPGLLGLKYGLADRLVFSTMKERFGGRIRFFVSAAAPISKEIIEFFHALDILIIEGWGMTETSAPSTINVPGHIKFGSVGRVLPGVDVKIADDGEIMVKGGNVFMGYWSKDGPITDEFADDGFFHTGDIGRIDGEGYLYITDRKKDIIITAGGKNIAPQNIENLLKVDMFISEALVFGDRKKFLSAILTLDEQALTDWAKKEGAGFDDFAELAKKPETQKMIEERIKNINKGLPKHETIKRIHILDRQFQQDLGEITPTMKLKRKALYQKFADVFDGMYQGLEDGGF